MLPHFIVVTARGALRAGWIEPSPLEAMISGKPDRTSTVHFPGRMPVHRPARIRWVASLDFVRPRQHFVEQVTDLSGNYAAAASSGAGGSPRRMQSSSSDVHWKLEADRLAVANLARAVEDVLSREKPLGWTLSAPTDIHKKLVDTIGPDFRTHLFRVIPKDLVDADTISLLEHFSPSLSAATSTSPPPQS